MRAQYLRALSEECNVHLFVVTLTLSPRGGGPRGLGAESHRADPSRPSDHTARRVPRRPTPRLHHLSATRCALLLLLHQPADEHDRRQEPLDGLEPVGVNLEELRGCVLARIREQDRPAARIASSTPAVTKSDHVVVRSTPCRV